MPVGASIWSPDEKKIPIYGQLPPRVEEVLPVSIGQTNFVLTEFNFVPNTSSLQLFLSGQRLHPAAYTEGLDGESFTLLYPPIAAGEILACGSLPDDTGAIAIASDYVAGAPAATGFLTIKDGSGVMRKLLVG